MVGLAFKPGTDDLRESPMVTLVVFDPNVAIARLVGANWRYILMCDDLETLVEQAEVLVIGSPICRQPAAASARAASSLVVDLTRGAGRQLAPRAAEPRP